VQLENLDGNPMTRDEFISLYRDYALLFSDGFAASGVAVSHLDDVWYKILSIFLVPIVKQKSTQKHRRIFIRSEIELDGLPGTIFINFPLIYDLCYYFLEDFGFTDIYFINVSDNDPVRFLQRFAQSPKAKYDNLSLLYGFLPQFRKEIFGKEHSVDEAVAAVKREHMFNSMLQLAKEKGSEVQYLEHSSQLKKLFAKTDVGKIIVVAAHFGSFFFRTRTDQKTVSIYELIAILNELDNSQNTRDDITLIALACNNFRNLNKLYHNGISSIYYMSGNLNTNLASLMTWELYSCANAKDLNSGAEYLCGQYYFCEAWSKVRRCINVNLQPKNKLKQPHMASIPLTVTGSTLLDFSEFIEILKYSPNSSIKELEITPTFPAVAENETAAHDILQLFFELDKAILVEVVASFIVWLIKGKKNEDESEDTLTNEHEKSPLIDLHFKTTVNGKEKELHITNVSREDAMVAMEKFFQDEAQ
jgi:hypothetical protein